MAITLVGTPQAGGASNGGDVTLTFDGTPAEGDVVLLFGGNADSGGTGDIGPSTAGYTERALRHTTDEKYSAGVWTKVLGASPDSSVTGLGSGVAQEATAYMSFVLRGVDTTNVLDVAIEEVDIGSTEFPDCAAVVTTVDGVWVFPLIAYDNDETLWDSYPSGYTNTISVGQVDTRRIGLAGASKEVATAGSEDPGPYDTSGGLSFDFYGFTVAIRPASTGTTDRTGQVSWAELEAPNAPREGQVSWAELEIPTAPREGQVSWAELEVPTAPREGQVSWAELELPTSPRRAVVSWAEMEIGTAPRSAQVSWAEMEMAEAPRVGQVSWAEAEVPTSPRGAQMSWTELEVPLAPRRATVSWAEMEVGTAPRTGQVSWAELEVPPTDARGEISWAEFEVPSAPGDEDPHSGFRLVRRLK